MRQPLSDNSGLDDLAKDPDDWQQAAVFLRGLFETIILLLVLMALEPLVFGQGAYAELAVHPFWFVVLLASMQNGLVNGLFAALFATIFLDRSAPGIDQSIAEFALETARLPIFWIVSALIVGGFRHFQRSRQAALEQERDQLLRTNESLAAELHVMDSAVARLELSLTLQNGLDETGNHLSAAALVSAVPDAEVPDAEVLGSEVPGSAATNKNPSGKNPTRKKPRPNNPHAKNQNDKNQNHAHPLWEALGQMVHWRDALVKDLPNALLAVTQSATGLRAALLDPMGDLISLPMADLPPAPLFGEPAQLAREIDPVMWQKTGPGSVAVAGGYLVTLVINLPQAQSDDLQAQGGPASASRLLLVVAAPDRAGCKKAYQTTEILGQLLALDRNGFDPMAAMCDQPVSGEPFHKGR